MAAENAVASGETVADGNLRQHFQTKGMVLTATIDTVKNALKEEKKRLKARSVALKNLRQKRSRILKKVSILSEEDLTDALRHKIARKSQGQSSASSVAETRSTASESPMPQCEHGEVHE